MKTYGNVGYSSAQDKMIKRADEKKINLRKVIYEINRLSYERGTRSGDYLIRKKIQAINDELDLYDSKINLCEFGKGNYSVLMETLLFFEKRYLDDPSLTEYLEELKGAINDEKNADKKHNENHKDDKYKRSTINKYRDELGKDLKKFEYGLSSKIFPVLNEFLFDVNTLLFYSAIYENTKKWPSSDNIADSNYEKYADFKTDINFFLKLCCKIQKNISCDEAITAIGKVLYETDIKSRLFNYFKIDENKYYNMINDIVRQFMGRQSGQEKRQADAIVADHTDTRMVEKETNDDLSAIIKNLQYLTRDTNYKTVAASQPGDSEVNISNRYLFYSVKSEKIFLKNITDYLKDSLLFINEWLLNELSKKRNLYDHLKLLTEHLPAEMNFYDLYENADFISSLGSNTKLGLWGEMKQYISKELAGDIVHSIEKICEGLKDAFVKTTLEIELRKSAENTVLAKKINIVYDSFENARKKIIKELSRLKSGTNLE